MPNITYDQPLAAIAALVAAVDDTGLVLTEEKFVEEVEDLDEVFDLIANQNAGECKGWLINYQGFTQEVGDVQCEVRRSLKFFLASIYPYDSTEDDDGKNSKTRFVEAIEGVNDSLNTNTTANPNWHLSLGNNVQHTFLQSLSDFAIAKWNSGAGTQLQHVGIFELIVQVSFYT